MTKSVVLIALGVSLLGLPAAPLGRRRETRS